MALISTIVFSKDRPLQLDLALSSMKLHCRDIEESDIYVLYKTSNEKYQKAYNKLFLEHPHITPVKETNFKQDLLKSMDGIYTLFLVDDCIFVRDFGFVDYGGIVEFWPTDQLGFSLRLGLNIKHCYPVNKPQSPVNYIHRYGRIFINWTEQTLDFAYPLEVSSSIYQTKRLLPFLKKVEIENPNHLEALIDSQKYNFSRNFPMLQFFVMSIAFCSPMNKVQEVANNRSYDGKGYDPEDLLIKYLEGERIYPSKFDLFVPTSPHQEVLL